MVSANYWLLIPKDPETGIVGDEMDITRRQAIFGKHEIAMPKIEGFIKLTARQFEDPNCVMLCWAATVYLVASIFGTSTTAYVESLTIYTGLLLICVISGLCDWWKEKQLL